MSKAPTIAPDMQVRSRRIESEVAVRRPKARAAPAAPDRLAWVDVARGLCIVLVVMMHSTLGLGEAVGGEGWLHKAVEFARPFRIPAFFLIAGLFLSRTIGDPWPRFLDRKVLHFAYFYLLWTVIQCVVKFGPAEGAAGVARAFGIALVEPFGALWFIYLLPVFFVVTKLSRRIPAWIMLAEGAAMHLWPHETGFVAIDEFMSRFVFFYAGYLFAPRILSFAEEVRRNRDVVLPAIVAVGALLAALSLNPGLTRAFGLSLPLAALGAGALIATAALLEPTRAGRIAGYCGRHSIVIYLAFFLPMAATRIALVKSGLVGTALDVGTASAIVTLAAVVGPLILHRIVRGGIFGWLFERPRWARLSAGGEANSRYAAA